MVIIGSVALKHWFPDFNREPKDLDIAIEGETYSQLDCQGNRIEYLKNPIIVKYSKGQEYLVPELLLTLKMSHLPWDIFWAKNMWDTQFLLSKGVKYDKDIFFELYDYWNTVHEPNKRSDLTMQKEEFFDNALKEFDHDHLHTLLNPNPTYIGMLKEGCTVELDPEKFAQSSIIDKKNLIYEETAIMAFERYRKKGYKHAYSIMIKQYLMNHVPFSYGFLFLVENWIELHKAPYDFVKVIEEHPNFHTAKTI